MANQLSGKKAPEFTLPASSGGTFSLSDFDGKWKVVFFYAKDGSPTLQARMLDLQRAV